MSLLAPLLRIYFFPYFQKRDLYSRLSYDKIAYKKKKPAVKTTAGAFIFK